MKDRAGLVSGGVTEAIVPVRGLPAGKTRLAALLTVDQRNRLVRAMLHDVVAALRQVSALGRITILSRDAAAAREAERLGVAFLQQPSHLIGLNPALAFAQRVRAGSAALLIVPADLPLLTAQDVERVLAALGDERGVVIAPADDGGTNGLYVRPPGVIAPAYGQRSAARHERAARAAGVLVRTIAGDRWALDLDTPEDLPRCLALAAGRPGADVLATVRCLRAPDFPPFAPSTEPGEK